tara:strand:+ start:6804 stop:7499 length:696 start_codon:yes stop_codon:yes gene_type:complete
MANIQIATADGSTLGNPPIGDFYIFIDSNNSDAYTLRNSSGTDTILGGGSSGVTSFQASNGTFIDFTPTTSQTGVTTLTADLSASSPDATKFLRGDNTWQVPSSATNYFKADVLINSGSVSASASDVAVPGLTYTIPAGKGGDYVFYAVISVDIDNSDMKPMSLMIFKNGVKETNSVTMDFAKKNENQSVQLTYAMDSLVATDVIAIYVNNDNEDINDIIVGRILAQSWTQ